MVQVCLLDLEYGLPVQVRDQALGMANEGLPESDAGKEYALQRMQVGAHTAHRSSMPCACDSTPHVPRLSEGCQSLLPPAS
jgi:hypothetical protein